MRFALFAHMIKELRKREVYLSPFWILAIVIVTIFCAEFTIMFLLSFTAISSWGENIVDSFFLIIIIFPILYLFVLRPLKFYVAELKNIEEGLRKSNERFDLAVRGTNDGIWDWDIETNTNYFSPRFLELLGYGPDELPHELATFEFLLHPEDRAWVFDRVRHHLEDKVPYNVEYRMRTKDVEYRWFQARGEAIRDQSGKPFRMAGSITDITERKKAEEKLKQYIDELERFQKVAVKREFRIKELQEKVKELRDENESLNVRMTELEEKLRKAYGVK